MVTTVMWHFFAFCRTFARPNIIPMTVDNVEFCDFTIIFFFCIVESAHVPPQHKNLCGENIVVGLGQQKILDNGNNFWEPL